MTKSFSFHEQMARQSSTALYLYLDIETIPSQDPAVLEAIRAKHVVAPLDLSAVEADKRLKDPEKIEEDLARKRQKAVEDHAYAIAKAELDIDTEWRKTALDASSGHIVCASVAIADQPVESVATPAFGYAALQGSSAEVGSFVGAVAAQVTSALGIDERSMLKSLFHAVDIMIEARAALEAMEHLERNVVP